MEESGGSSPIKIIAIVISVLLIIVAGFAMFEYSRQTNEERTVLEDVAGPVNEQLSRLHSRRDELQLQLDDIEDQMQLTDDRLCSTMVLVSECRSSMIVDIVPKLDSYGYGGILVISDRYAPGMNGCLSWDDVDVLVSKGWELCVSTYDVTSIDELRKLFEDNGRAMPKVFFSSVGPCSENAENILVNAGFDTIIEYAGYASEIVDGKPWHMPSQGCNNDLSKTTLINCMATSEPIIYSVGYETEGEIYDEKTFGNMLKRFKQYESAGTLKVTNLAEARERYAQHMENVKANAASLQGEHDAIQAQIDEINAEIDELRGGN